MGAAWHKGASHPTQPRPAFPKQFRGKIIDAAEVNQQR